MSTELDIWQFWLCFMILDGSWDANLRWRVATWGVWSNFSSECASQIWPNNFWWKFVRAGGGVVAASVQHTFSPKTGQFSGELKTKSDLGKLDQSGTIKGRAEHGQSLSGGCICIQRKSLKRWKKQKFHNLAIWGGKFKHGGRQRHLPARHRPHLHCPHHPLRGQRKLLTKL